MPRLRVLVADDNLEFFEKLRSLLAVEFEVVATAADGKSALDLIRRTTPDVAVLDLAIPGLNGIEVIKELASSPYKPPVVICSVITDPEVVKAALQTGASAYVFKIRVEKDLISAVRAVVQHQSFVSAESD